MRPAESIRPKRYFALIFAASSFLLALFTFVLYQQWEVLHADNLWIRHSYEVLRDARSLFILTLDMETGQRGYLLTRNALFLGPYEKAAADLDSRIAALKTTVSDDPIQQENLAHIETDMGALERLLNQHNLTVEQGGAVTFQNLVQSKTAMDRLRLSFVAFIDREDELLHRRLDRLEHDQHLYTITLFAGSCLVIAGLCLANLAVVVLLVKGRRFEMRLRNFEAGYRLVLEGVSDGIFDYDPQTGAVLYSPSYQRLLGYTPAEMPNTIETYNRLLHPDDYAEAWSALERYMRREIPAYSTVFRMRHKNGSWRWILARGVGVWDDQDRIQRFVGTHTDITVQKEREEELRQLNQELESFTYISSHDLRGPLVNLKGFAGEISMALDEALPAVRKLESELSPADRRKMLQAFDEDIPEALGFIRAAVEKMDALTNAILDLSRIGRREYRMEPVDAGTVIKRCLDSLAYEIHAKNIEVRQEELPTVITDALALEQVFGNVLDNAVKYLDPSRPGVIVISAKSLPHATQFTVEDNGRGIASADRQKVFDIFRRAGNAGNVRGFGVGMAFVKATMRKLGGRIWFESAPGMGTAFHFIIPTPSKEEVP